MRDRLVPGWVKNATINRTSEAFIKKHGLYLWAFGENKKRALSVQQKLEQIEAPEISKITLKDNLLPDDYIV